MHDAAGGGHYYYNSVTAETTWTQPPGWGAALPAAQAGWHYRDLQGAVQGPFELAQLTAWRSALPMELQVWWTDGGGGAGGPAAVAPLAAALGDGELLTLLRTGQLPLPANATAAQVEAALAAAAAAADAQGNAWWDAQLAAQEQEAAAQAAAAAAAAEAGEEPPVEEGGGFSFAELAAASLAGLPPDERSRVLAGGGSGEPPRRAAPVQDEYDSAPVLNRMTGRLTSSVQLRGDDFLAAKLGAAPEYFSAQMDAHCDTTKLEAWLQGVAERKHEKLPTAVWKALKERRAEKKKKVPTWLRD